MIRLGYDGITTVMVTYVATQIGFALSWMNPFSVAIAQGIAGIPILSGIEVRIPMWISFTLLGLLFTMNYATKVKKNPELSYSHRTDHFLRQKNEEIEFASWCLGYLVILTITITTAWVIGGEKQRHFDSAVLLNGFILKTAILKIKDVF